MKRFHRQVWYHVLSLRYVQIQHSGIIHTPEATIVPNFVSIIPSIAELARGEKSHTQSVTQSLNQSITHSPSLIDVPGTEAFTLE